MLEISPAEGIGFGTWQIGDPAIGDRSFTGDKHGPFVVMMAGDVIDVAWCRHGQWYRRGGEAIKVLCWALIPAHPDYPRYTPLDTSGFR